MYTILKRALLIAFVVILGVTTPFEMKFSQASASENAASSGGHVALIKEKSPIELGPSQEARCKLIIPSDRIQYAQCALFRRLLASMDAEPRDEAWADQIELELTKWVESMASDGFTLRKVACRLSWCVVEVGSVDGRILNMRPNDAQKIKLFEVRDMFAPDVHDSNVQDQVIFYKRYCNSAGELLDGNGRLVPNLNAVGHAC